MELFLTQMLEFSLVAMLYGGVGSLVLLSNNRFALIWGSTFAFIGSLSAMASGFAAIFGMQTASFHATTSFALLSLSFRVDQLSGIFLVIIGAVGALATLYGWSYMKHNGDTYRLGAFFASYNLFLASMVLVVIANQALFFLLAWELMALASYFLVVFDHRNEESVKAGYIYFIMTHVATAFIILLSFIFYHTTGSLDFDVWRAESGSLTALSATLVFIFALIGFGTKAGIIPVHVWLPAAHPAAPSHVSALMSGVMIKLGIYMFIRVFFDFFLHTPMWLGVVIVLLGASSSVLGVIYALSEHDIKRLLAYHSIENIGIILLGLGAALIFRGIGENALSLLALAASLFHVVNHAIFKSLLFLSAGSVVLTTNSRNMEEFGGLGKRMPYTAVFFLIGSIAISGIIPFNGFVSEWLTFQSLFGGLALSGVGLKVLFTLGIASLALTGGLAAACFVKAFGVTFLARPRSREASEAHDSSLLMNLAMGSLAFAALFLGVYGAAATRLFVRIAESVNQSSIAQIPIMSFGNMGFTVRNGFAGLNMPALFLLLSFFLLATWLIMRAVLGKQRISKKITWDCGFPLTPRMEITSTAFAYSLMTIFRPILTYADSTKTVYQDPNLRHFVSSQSVHLHLVDMYMKYFYFPIARVFCSIARQMSRIQNGYINLYILYVLVTLVALLAWALILPQS